MKAPDSETIILDRALNEALVNVDISRGYEEYLAIFDRYYAEDVEVGSDSNPDPVIGKQKVLPVLFNSFLPLHVMAEIGGLSVTLQYAPIPSDRRVMPSGLWSYSEYWEERLRWNGFQPDGGAAPESYMNDTPHGQTTTKRCAVRRGLDRVERARRLMER